MHPSPTSHRTLGFRHGLAGSLLAALVFTAPLVGHAGRLPGDKGKESAGEPPEPGAVEVRFTDDSTLKLKLRDEKLEVTTPYGKLLVPVADVVRIDFATRLPEEVARRIESGISDLGNSNFKQRETATADLLKLRDKAYPALLQAAQQKDAEVVRRAQALIEQIREAVPPERLEVRKFDVIQTEHSRFAGRIEGASLKALTSQFGEVQVKLTDVRYLRALSHEPEPDLANALPDPGSLTTLQNQVGKSFLFRVTGAVNGSVWGTDVYTSDSSLAAAAVHCGVVQPGQVGVVRVKIVPPPVAFQGSTRNGITSSPYGMYLGAYQVLR